MFSKGNKETQGDSSSNIENLISSNSVNTDLNNDPYSTPIADSVMDKEQIQTVKLVEKISGILSPYFIVIVGLYLCDRSFLIGFIFILIGILSLLKVSVKDILGLVDKIKILINNKNN